MMESLQSGGRSSTHSRVPNARGEMRIISFIDRPDVIKWFDGLTTGKILQHLGLGLRIEIRPALFHHRAKILAELLDGSPPHVPVPAIDIMDGEVGKQRKGVRDRGLSVLLGGFHHIELLDRNPLLIAEKRKCGSQAGLESGVALRAIGADHDQLAIIDFQLVLKFGQKTQLRLALGSPVTAVEIHHYRKPFGDLREPGDFSFVIGKLQIREAATYFLVHGFSPFPRTDWRLCIRKSSRGQ